jgi:hypothetical protein
LIVDDDVTGRLQKCEKSRALLVCQWTRLRGINGIPDFRARQDEFFANGDGAFSRRADFRIPDAVSPIITVIVNREIGVDIEVANHGCGVFLRNGEPHAHRLCALRHFRDEFSLDLKRRLAWLNRLRKIAAKSECGNSYQDARHYAAENQIPDSCALRNHDSLRGEESSPAMNARIICKSD